MKKCKKTLSLLLASIMAFSALSVGLSAFAAGDEAVTKVEESIRVATAWSDELANEWKALTVEQKDTVKPQRLAKILEFAWKQAGGKMDKEREKKQGICWVATLRKLRKQ